MSAIYRAGGSTYGWLGKGRARAKDRRQKRNRKIKLKKSYEESKKWLNEVKSKSGCCFCGENDGRVLRFCPRDGKGIKFLPVLANITRSLRDWKQVIRRCDVICLNCLAKRRLSRKCGRPRKVRMAATANEMPGNSAWHSASATIEREKSKIRGNGRFPEEAKTKAPQKAAGGQADGLQEIVAELAEVRP